MRSKRCTICTKLTFDELNTVDKRLRDGDPVLRVAREHNLSRAALDRHKKAEHHLEPPLRTPQEQAALDERERKAQIMPETEPLQRGELTDMATELARYLRQQFHLGKQRGFTVETAKVLISAIRQADALLGTPLTQEEVDAELERGARVLVNAAMKACDKCRPEIEKALLEGAARDVGWEISIRKLTPEEQAIQVREMNILGTKKLRELPIKPSNRADVPGDAPPLPRGLEGQIIDPFHPERRSRRTAGDVWQDLEEPGETGEGDL